MSELKKCPFCGGEAHIDTEYDVDGFGNFHYVKCKDCGAKSRQHFVSSWNECPQYYQEVRDDWQDRPIEDKLTAEINRLTIESNKFELQAEELESLMLCFDDIGLPRDKDSRILSAFGRVSILKNVLENIVKKCESDGLPYLVKSEKKLLQKHQTKPQKR